MDRYFTSPSAQARVSGALDSPIVDSRTGRMAVARPVGGKADEVLHFQDPAAGRRGPIAGQMHNATLFDAYKDAAIETDPPLPDLIAIR